MKKPTDSQDELRLRTHTVRLSNQSIVELAYLAKEAVETTAEVESFERRNC